MSGVEVAGLVLAAFPIIISALEHYSNGISILKDIHYEKRTLRSLKAKLDIQKRLYKNTLHTLLLPELSDFEREELFPAVPAGELSSLWESKDVEKKLRRRLGNDYDIFMAVVIEMDETMQKLRKKLEIDLNEKPKLITQGGTIRIQDRVGWEWRRIRRGFTRPERESLIDGFVQYNTDLGNLVHQREVLAPKTDDRATRMVQCFDVIRQEALDLYAIFDQNWRCSCGNSHKTYLCLEHPIGSEEKLHFGVVFRGAIASKPNKLTRVHISAAPKPHEETSAEMILTTATSTQSSSPSNSALTPKNSVINITNKIKMRTIRFSVGPEDSVRHKSVDTTANDGPRIGSDSSQASEISQLRTTLDSDPAASSATIIPSPVCQALRSMSTPTATIGSFPDAAREHFATIRHDSYGNDLSLEVVCLDSLLGTASRHRQTSRGRISEKDRLYIALTLASAVLQLYDSPWLDRSWSRADVYFFSSEVPGVAGAADLAIGNPFVEQEFELLAGPRAAAEATTEAPESPEIAEFIPSKVLFALAIVLIELCLDRSFTDGRQSPSTFLEDFQSANRLLDAVYRKSGENYGAVVQRCLKCEFSITPRQKTLSFDKFRRLVWEGVVSPLEENYKTFLKHRGES